MSKEVLNTISSEMPCRSIDDVEELYGLDRWTIRMWCNWFGIPANVSTDGGMLFSQRAVERIGVILGLVKKKMTLNDVRQHLETEFDGK